MKKLFLICCTLLMCYSLSFANTSLELNIDDYVYPWVENLNIRNAPNTKGAVVARVSSGDRLLLTGNQSSEKLLLTLRGVAYHEPWYSVRTDAGIDGWVFGGAVKHKGEHKGKSKLKKGWIEYEHFGNYNLSQWRKLETKDASGGDATIGVDRYKRGSQYLEVATSDVGEYGFGNDQKLMGANGKVLKERSFSWSSGYDEGNKITEVVKDYMSSPAKEYTRTYYIQASSYTLGRSRPVMATGKWSVKSIMGVNSTSGGAASSSSGSYTLEPVNYQNCTSIANDDSGCSCNFRVGEGYKTDEIFISGGGEDACIQLNGKIIAIKGGPVSVDNQELLSLSKYVNWIELNASAPDNLFGETIDFDDDANHTKAEDMIYNVLMEMQKLPDYIPIAVNGRVDIDFRTSVVNTANRALAKAKSDRASGHSSSPQQMIFSNSTYQVIINYKNNSQRDSGGSDYKGELEVIHISSSKVIAKKKVWGFCGC